MADFGSVIKQLDDLKKKVGADLAPQVQEIRDALGRLSVEVGEMTAEHRPQVDNTPDNPRADTWITVNCCSI